MRATRTGGGGWGKANEGLRLGAPKFRSRQRDGIGSFRLTGAIRVEYVETTGKKPSGRNKRTHQAFIYLPRIGRVRLREADRFPEGALTQVTVTEHAGHWYVSAQMPAAIKTKYAKRERNLMPVGGDLGLKSWMVLSDGTTYESPKALRGAQRKLRRLEREKSRRERGSQNRAKTRKKLQRVHAHVAYQRADAIHKMTTSMATTNTRLVIEDVNAAGMSKNHALAQAIIDAAFAEIRRQLTYKCEWYGCGLELAPRFYPSTQTCSGCGLVKTADEGPNPKLTLKERVYRCEGPGGCGLVLDRDENAALVLAALSGTEHVRTLVAVPVPNAAVVVVNLWSLPLRGDLKRLWSGEPWRAQSSARETACATLEPGQEAGIDLACAHAIAKRRDTEQPILNNGTSAAVF